MRKAEILVIAFLIAAFCSAQINALPIEVTLLADESRSFNLANYEVHDPILISSDDDFVIQGWPGNGTVEEPYVIENLSISVSHDQGYCIEIKNAQSHFVVRNCFLYGISYTSAIVLRDTMNGLIEYNQCNVTGGGIQTFDGWNNTVRSNNCTTDGGTAIYFCHSENSTISENLCFNGSIFVHQSSNNSTIVGNVCFGSSIGFSSSDYVTILNNTCPWIISDSHPSESRSYDCAILGNIITGYESPIGVSRSIYLLRLASSIVANNTVLHTCGDAIDISYCESIAVINNTVIESDHAIGISGECSNISVLWNTFNAFLGDSATVYNHGELSFFDYNYYSDYDGVDANGDGVGDIPYENCGVLDIHPLMYPPGSSPLLDSPDDIELEEGTTNHSIVWSPSILSPASYRVHRNDSLVVDSGVWNGSIIVSVDGLNLGVYNYTLTIFDASGSSASDTVFVTVVEPTPPTIDSPDDIQYESGTTDHNITWSPSDLTPDSYEVLRNGTQIDSGPWGGSDIEISIDGLDLGTHNFTLVVFDVGGNNVGDTVMVIVVDTTDPSLTTPEDIQFKFGDASHNLAWMLQDMNPFSYEVFMNSTLIASGTWNSTGETVTITLDGIPIGVHFFTIYVTDFAGNEASDMVIVTVLPDSTTTGTSTTDTTTTSPPADSQFQIMDVLGLGIGFGVLLSVIVFVVLRKRE